jgi:glucosamine--fructose-6-phosphate aminotransferase (isomerizing)
MCGIVGYVGTSPACDVLVEGLKRLEYRGYDSAGLCVIRDGQLCLARSPGRIANLEERIDAAPEIRCGTIGIAHTRWATHGEPNEANAHPHLDATGRLAVVHNGIIENYATLRTYLQEQGCEFRSQTDTEVLPHLIRTFLDAEPGVTLEHAVQQALAEVSGTYGLAVICADEPEKLIVARRGSPLIVGVGSDEYVVASDASAILEHTANVIYLNDGEMAVVTPAGLRTTTVDNVPVTKEVSQIEWSIDQIAKGGYEHFMLKEIMEQPDSTRQAIRGRLDLREGRVVLGGLEPVARDLARMRKLVITACGTAWHAGLVGE